MLAIWNSKLLLGSMWSVPESVVFIVTRYSFPENGEFFRLSVCAAYDAIHTVWDPLNTLAA